MAFIDYITYDDASPELKALYETIGAPKRVPANIVRIAGVNPKAMAGHLAFYRGLMSPASALKPAQREMIAVAVSGINQCHY